MFEGFFFNLFNVSYSITKYVLMGVDFTVLTRMR